MKNIRIEIGDIFNRWEVIDIAYPAPSGGTRWRCRCICGKEKDVYRGHLISGKSKSCGCLRAETTKKIATKHGRRKDPVYQIWRGMLNRCSNSSDTSYQNYGGRGITVCDRWNISKGGSFENFLDDMGECPEGMTLDRIDVNGNYCKENCRWTTYSEQNFNQRIKKSNKTGVTGVWYRERDKKYVAYITNNKVRMFLGSFSTLEEATLVRKLAEIKYYGYNKEGGNE